MVSISGMGAWPLKTGRIGFYAFWGEGRDMPILEIPLGTSLFGGSINIRGHFIIGTQKDQHVDTSSYLQAQACYPHKMKPGVHKAGDKTKSED